MVNTKPTHPAVALLPLFVFIATFLGAGILLSDTSSLSFYALPSPIAAVIGICAAFILFKSSINTKVENLIQGCGQPQIVVMCIIYLLAGGFATMTKHVGGVDAVVYFGSEYLSLSYLYAGIFLLASFVSFASGTSVGSITAIAPIAAGFLSFDEVNGPLLAASLLSGAMFGDNLSLISDTTIAATQTQECDLKDKFRINSRIAFPAAITTLILLLIIGFLTHPSDTLSSATLTPTPIVRAIPYLVVIIFAVAGINVLITLFTGILTAVAVGMIATDISLLDAGKITYDGFTSMSEIFFLSMLSAGLIFMVEREGGIRYLIEKLTTFASSKGRSYLGISLLVGGVDAAIANNTVAILVTGPVANKLRKRFKISGDHSASVLDISSCIVQGIIPWGAQVLILLEQMGPSVGYFAVVAQSYYLGILGLFTIAYFAFMPRLSNSFDESNRDVCDEPTLS